MTSTLQRGSLVAAATLALTLPACSSDDASDSGPSSSSSNSTAASETGAAPVVDGPFGPACATLPADGEGSVAGMVDDPVMTAAASNPFLTGLVAAVTTAHLGESLNGLQNITVLAPVDQGFLTLPPGDVPALLADSPRLTALLTHHVIQGRLTPEQLAGTHTTLNNDEVTIEGSGQSFTVDGAGTLTQTVATVICGNLQTANATVYLIDQVLAPAPQ